MTTFKSILIAIFGLTLALLGLAHSVSSYPGAAVFDRLMVSLPTLSAVLAFAIGVGVSVGGFVLAIVAARAMRHHSHARNAISQRRVGLMDGTPSYEHGGYDPRRYGRQSMNGTGEHEDEYEYAGAYR